jgi:hypothetical protein
LILLYNVSVPLSSSNGGQIFLLGLARKDVGSANDGKARDDRLRPGRINEVEGRPHEKGHRAYGYELRSRRDCAFLVPIPEGWAEPAMVEEPEFEPGRRPLEEPEGADEEDRRGNAGDRCANVAERDARDTGRQKGRSQDFLLPRCRFNRQVLIAYRHYGGLWCTEPRGSMLRMTIASPLRRYLPDAFLLALLRPAAALGWPHRR